MATITRTHLAIILLLLTQGCAFAQSSDEERGFLDRPPVFIDNMVDFPLAGMGVELPAPRHVLPAVDTLTISSNAFNRNDVNVQPGLDYHSDVIRLGALYAFDEQWGAMASVPWYRNRTRGTMGGLPATSTIEGLGGVSIFGKRMLIADGQEQRLALTAGIELPNGPSHATFDQSNAATNGYYTGFPQRLPLGWQPSSGTLNGYVALGYGRRMPQISYVALAAVKINGTDDEDAKIGNIFVLAFDATYGVTPKLAVALGLTLRKQGDDSYPQAPAPGVDQQPLVGTTSHGTTLYVIPSVRYNIAKLITVGISVSIPAVKPDDGMVDDTRFNVLFYPSL